MGCPDWFANTLTRVRDFEDVDEDAARTFVPCRIKALAIPKLGSQRITAGQRLVEAITEDQGNRIIRKVACDIWIRSHAWAPSTYDRNGSM